MTKLVTNKRDLSWDIAKGFCILLMIIGHCPVLSSWTHGMIESFHMPFFFVAAGVFYKEKNTTTIFTQSAQRLLLPLLIGSAVCALVCILLHHPENSIRLGKALLFPGGTPRKAWLCNSWPDLGVFGFLAALFWCRIFYNELQRFCKRNLLLICMGISCATAIISRRIVLPLGINEACSGLVFYAFGHFCQSRGIFDRKLPPVALLVFILLWIIETRFVHFRMYLMGYDYLYPIGVTFACGMTIVLVRCAKFINTPPDSYSRRIVTIWFLQFRSDVLSSGGTDYTILPVERI